MLTGIIAVIIFLSILVLVHEFGHFFAAKKFGLLVEEFGIGLPPRIWGKKIGETLYSINALPIGGFVKIFGENREESLSEQSKSPKLHQNVSSQIQIAEKEFSNEFVISSSQNNRNFGSLSISKRAIIIFAGVLMNFILGWFVISIVFLIGVPQTILITEIQPNSPASQIGLQIGDKILSVSDEIRNLEQSALNVNNFIKFINEHQTEEISLKIERQGIIKDFKAIPRANFSAGEGALGIGLVETGLPKKNLLASVWEGLKTAIETVGAIFIAFFNLIFNAVSGKATLQQIAGPVGIVKITAQAGSLGFVYLLQLLALISLNLAVLNIFPFPALDGGRLLFLFIEKIKGSPLPIKFEQYANAIGMALLLSLMIIITIKDIVKF